MLLEWGLIRGGGRGRVRTPILDDHAVGCRRTRAEEPPQLGQRRILKIWLTCRAGMGKAEERPRARVCGRGIMDLGQRPTMRDRVAIRPSARQKGVG